MKLTHRTVHVLTSALNVAIQTYQEDAEHVRAAGLESLAEKFETQAREARELLEELEQSEVEG